MKKHALKIFFIIALAMAAFVFCQNMNTNSKALLSSGLEPEAGQKPIKKDLVKNVAIIDGSTYGSLMASSGIEYAVARQIYDAAQEIYDLVKIRAGRELTLIFDADGNGLKTLNYKIDSEDELFVNKKIINEAYASSTAATSSLWQAEIKAIPYDVKTKTANGTIETSMYQAALDNNIDIRAIIELANAFQWTIDFAMDPRVGDTFKFIYEERYLDGEYIMPGRILAGRYTNAGEKFDVYYFEESEDNKGFFDENGNSVQKMFLKAPVAFKYISSGYTTGARYVAEFQTYTSSHMAIDYASALGSPVRAVGDGTVISAGWNSHGYGNLVSIRHNGTYATNYAHLSKIYVRYGQKVKQGDIIGAVGSTGFSTGPHLHYEMVKNGAKVNPLREILPPGTPIAPENKERFFNDIKTWQEELDK